MKSVVELIAELGKIKEGAGGGFEKNSQAQHIARVLLCEIQETGDPILKPWADVFIAEKVNNPIVILDRMTALTSGRK